MLQLRSGNSTPLRAAVNLLLAWKHNDPRQVGVLFESRHGVPCYTRYANGLSSKASSRYFLISSPPPSHTWAANPERTSRSILLALAFMIRRMSMESCCLSIHARCGETLVSSTPAKPSSLRRIASRSGLSDGVGTWGRNH